MEAKRPLLQSKHTRLRGLSHRKDLRQHHTLRDNNTTRLLLGGLKVAWARLSYFRSVSSQLFSPFKKLGWDRKHSVLRRKIGANELDIAAFFKFNYVWTLLILFYGPVWAVAYVIAWTDIYIFRGLKKKLQWTHLNPQEVLEEVRNLRFQFPYGMVEAYMKRAGITSAYMKKPCLDPRDVHCPETAPNKKFGNVSI